MSERLIERLRCWNDVTVSTGTTQYPNRLSSSERTLRIGPDVKGLSRGSRPGRRRGRKGTRDERRWKGR